VRVLRYSISACRTDHSVVCFSQVLGCILGYEAGYPACCSALLPEDPSVGIPDGGGVGGSASLYMGQYGLHGGGMGPEDSMEPDEGRLEDEGRHFGGVCSRGCCSAKLGVG
jgi:hypothetical protein